MRFLPNIRTRRQQYPHSSETAPPPREQPTIPCGICRRQFAASNLEALFAHIGAHFDQRHRFNRCDACQINFVNRTDLDLHLRSVREKGVCGYMFQHDVERSCSGHHPPHHHRASIVSSSAFSKDDSTRFDFCYRLPISWERTQMKASTPSRPPSLLNPALLRTICTGSSPLVSSLLHAGAETDFPDALGFSALHYAGEYGTPEIFWLLLESGVEINARDGSGATALGHAVRAGNSGLLHFLVAWGAEVGVEDVRSAVERGSAEGLEVLLEGWVDRGRGVQEFEQDLYRAVGRGERGVVGVLLEYGVRPGGLELEIGGREILRELFAKGLEPNGWWDDDWKELGRYRHLAMMEVLLAREGR